MQVYQFPKSPSFCTSLLCQRLTANLMPAKRGREDTPLATAGKAVKADDVLSLINAYDASLEQRREQVVALIV